jgi:hypothetical protein
MSIKELDDKIEELKKEREVALLELEIQKIKKTVVEETIIEKRIVNEYPIWNYYPVTSNPNSWRIQ